MYNKAFLFIPLLFSFISSNAQIGGNNTFEFLNLSPSARTTALGANHISIVDDDVDLAFTNPSLLNESFHSQLSLGVIKYFSGIKYGTANYAHQYKNCGTFLVGFQYVTYGDFDYTDETGEILAGFGATDHNLNIGWGMAVDTTYSIGANLKTIYSQYEGYNSLGFALDIAGTYYNEKKKLAVAGLIKNMGTQVDAYRKGNKEPLPFDIQLGISKRLAHVPFRFSILAHHLYKFDIRYNDTNIVTTTSFVDDTTTKAKKYYADKAFRHLAFGGELLLSKGFNVRVGYNHLRRRELDLQNKFTMAGFSWGFGIKVKKFHFSYGRGIFHAAGPSNHFTLTARLSEFITSKAVN
ncbi:MAG: hypothetical protein COC01_07500 [Bacteroidetes bacterium]|nr:type IX secretion system protein PorQ [Bacteroidia bacterium]MBN4052358.1 type IX secretion system protein PorQ [Sphingobacteriaceae bacterium AH-315-L07]PCH66668.1 MAG: hypothetical protein COC01_07500 [Bacteroidota bacterium]